MEEANEKTALLQQKIEALKIRSNVDGYVANMQATQNLFNRPVRQGDRLFEIMPIVGPQADEGTLTGSRKGQPATGDTGALGGGFGSRILSGLGGVMPGSAGPGHGKVTSGTLQLKWSRVERRFNGTWGKGGDRHGTMSLRLVDNEIRGGWTTDEEAQMESGTPRLADLLWTRRAFKTQPAESPSVSRDSLNDRLIQRLQGQWKLVRIVDPGGADYVPRTSSGWIVEGHTMISFGSDVSFKTPFRVDESLSPAHFDMLTAGEGNSDHLGLIEVAGDRLKWAHSGNTGDKTMPIRPAKLEPSLGVYYCEMERVREDAQETAKVAGIDKPLDRRNAHSVVEANGPEAAVPLEVRAYAIQDLPLWSKDGTSQHIDLLIHYLEARVDSTKNGGDEIGSYDAGRRVLVVRGDARKHQHIAQLLTELRASSGQPADDLAKETSLKTYSIADLPIWSKDGKKQSVDLLLSYLRSNVDPPSWESKATRAAYNAETLSLAVQGTEEVHDGIKAALSRLRVEPLTTATVFYLRSGAADAVGEARKSRSCQTEAPSHQIDV